MRESACSGSPFASAPVETKIGLLPSSWEVISLEEVSDSAAPIRYGVVQVGPDTSDGVPIVQIKHIKRINSAALHRASPQIEAFYAGSRVREGDVLISVKGTIGEVGIVPKNFEGNIAREIARIRPNSSCNADFLAFQLEADHTQRRIDSKVVGSTRLEFSIHAVRDFLVALPPLPEQRAIATLLSTWNSAIQNTEQLILAKELHRDALIQRLYALSDIRGRSLHFRELLDESMEPGSSGRHAKKITVKLYGKGVLAKEEKRQGSEQTQYFVRRAGQLIYSKLDFLNGAFGIVPPELDGYESTLDLPAFDIAPTVNAIWLLGYLTRPTYYTRQLGLARGQRKARRVHPSDLLASSLRVPSRDLQDRIAEVLTSSQSDIDQSKRLLQSIKAQKRGLMQKLLTGQWRLPLPEPETA